MFKYIVIIFIFSASLRLSTQDVPSPGVVDNRRIYYTGATIHTGDGRVIKNGVLGTENGKILFVADDINVKLSPPDTTVLCTGKHIYPALISANSLLGLIEIGSVRATRDNYEVGDMNPNLRALIAYNTDSRVIPTVRSNGILYAQIRPEGGVIAGSSSVVQLDAWNWEDAQVKADDAIYMSWPALISRAGWWAEPEEDKKNDKYNTEVKNIEDFLAQARAYAYAQSPLTTNLKMEAMRDLFNGTKKLFVEANQQKQIIDAILICKKYKLPITIVGGRDSWMILDLLKENNVPVVLQKTHSLPYMDDDDIDIFYKLPAILQKAGIEFCITAENDSGEQRNLPFTAGKAAAYGLTKEQALSAITFNVAKILGLENEIGRLAEGMVASFIVSEGDVLDVRTNDVQMAFISGRKLNLGNRHKDLYKKFSGKYGIPAAHP